MAKGCCRKCRKQVLYVRDFDGKPLELERTAPVYLIQPDLLGAPAAAPVHPYTSHKCKCAKKEPHGKAS